jgi:uncharacterized protein
MEQRINVITLGVKDVQVSRRFYESLGWRASSISNEHLAAFQTTGIVFCLYPKTLLAEDATVSSMAEGYQSITLAYNVANKEEVQKILQQAVDAGARLIKPAQDVFWGGYSGYFSDPDGHLWEVAWNPHWPLKSDGLLTLPE